MYEISEERANELMLMELTVRREMEAIIASRADDSIWKEHLDVLDELIDVQIDGGILDTCLKIQDKSASYREKGEPRWFPLVRVLEKLRYVADTLIRGIER